MATLTEVLAQIRAHESGGNYGLTPQQNYNYPTSHASGAYQFQPGTWNYWTQQSGIGTQYSEAYLAPPNIQDAVAAHAATYGPGVNSTALWGASARGGYPAITSYDVTPGQLASAGGTGLPGGPLESGYGGLPINPGLSGDPWANPAGVGTPTTNPDLSNPWISSPSTSPGAPNPSAPYSLTNPEPGLGSLPGTQGPTPASPPGTPGGYPGNPGTDPFNLSTTGSGTGPTTVWTGLSQTLSSIASGATGTFTGAVSGALSSVANWVARFFLILVAIVVIGVALWRVAAPEMSVKDIARAAI